MPQLSRQLQTQILRSDTDPNFRLFDASGFVIQPEDELLYYRLNNNFREYEAVENDPMLGQLCDERRRSPSMREVKVYSSGENPDDLLAAEIVRKTIDLLDFDHLCESLNHAIFTGRSIVELYPDVITLDLTIGEKKVSRECLVPIRFEAKDPARLMFGKESDPKKFQHHLGFEARQTTIKSFVQGEPLPLNKFIIHSSGSLIGNPYGKGIYRRLYWLNHFKKEVLKLGLINSDGRPIPYVTHSQSATPAEIREAEQMLQSFYKNSWMMLSDKFKIDFATAFVQGQVQSLRDFLTWFDTQASTCILGATLTSQTSSDATRGSSEIHWRVSENRAKSDADMLSESLKEYFVKPIVQWNCAGAALPGIYRDFSPIVDRKKEAEIDGLLGILGYEPTEDRILEIFGPGYQKKGAVEDEVEPDEDDTKDIEGSEFAECANCAELDEAIDSVDFGSGNKLYFFMQNGVKRRTGIIASSAAAARKKCKRGCGRIYKVRALTAAEEKQAHAGRWVRSGPDPSQKAGYGSSRGYGPPRSSNHSEPEWTEQEISEFIEIMDFEAGERFKHKKLWRRAYNEARRKFTVFPSAYSSAYIVQAYKRLVKEAGLSVSDAFNYDEPNDEVIELSEPLDDVADFDLGQWFKEGWVRISSSGEIVGECGGRGDSEGFPKCLPRSKAESMSKEERAAAVRRKRSKVKRNHSGKPIHVATSDHAEPIEAEGFLLDDAEYDQMAIVTEEDVLAAIGEAIEENADR